MSDFRDKHLFARKPFDSSFYLKVDKDRPFVEAFFAHIKDVIAKDGDKPWMVNVGLLFKEAGIGNLSGTAFGSSRIMLSEVEPLSRQVAAALSSLGVSKGDVVQIFTPNTIDYHILIYAIWLCGAVPSLTEPGLHSRVVSQQLVETKAKVLICADMSLSKAVEAVGLLSQSVPIVLSGSTLQGELVPAGVTKMETILAKKHAQPPCPSFDIDDTCIIFWSSGTTGVPKGILHSWKLPLLTAKPSSPLALANPIVATSCFHLTGLVIPITQMAQSCIYLFHKDDLLDITNMYLAVDRFKCSNIICGVNYYLHMATTPPPNNLNLDSVGLILPIGALVQDCLEESLHKNFPKLQFCLNGYTMTEFGMAVTFSHSPRKLGGVGEGNVIKIVDSDTGELLGPNQVGELLVKPPLHMKGYLNRPEEEKEFFVGDGFCCTGDLGHYDEEGVLYYDGRIKDLIKPAGCHHVYPQEIENIIQKMAGVVEVGVFGRHDGKFADVLTALVVLQPDSKLTAKAITEEVARNVDDFKRLSGGVVFIQKLPRNEVGKILRRELPNTYNTAQHN